MTKFTSTLDAVQGSTAAKLFLTQMFAHHEGVGAMAETATGKNSDGVAMANSIIDSQTGQVDWMKALLASL